MYERATSRDDSTIERVRSLNHWSSPWFSEIIATTATSSAGTAATMPNMVTMRTCMLAPGSPRILARISSMASVTTSATTASTSRPLTTQMIVHTSGVGSISVAPVMIRNEPDDTNTDSSTITSPSVRTACRPVSPNSSARAGAASGSRGSSLRSVNAAVLVILSPV